MKTAWLLLKANAVTFLFILSATPLWPPRAAVAATSPVVSWGYSDSTNVPAGLTNVMLLAAGNYGNWALQADGTYASWGAGAYVTPGAGSSNLVAASLGRAGSFAIGIRADGQVLFWGANIFGEGNVPADLTNCISIGTGDFHAVAAKADGTVEAWGYNNNGQTNVPAGLSNVVAVAAGQSHCLALKADGTVVGWGSDGVGEVSQMAGLSGIVAVAGGSQSSLALRADGSVFSWGFVGAPNLTNAVTIATGPYHALALKRDGTVAAWGGYNPYGETTVPASLTNVQQIAAGQSHSTVLTGAPTPRIMRQPANTVAPPGGRTYFFAPAVGRQPLSYQWRCNGTNLLGANRPNLILNNCQASNAGNYTVVVTNSFGVVTSAVATLTVMPTPTISSISNQRTFRGVPMRTIPFTVSNVVTATFSATSTDANLVPTNNIIFGGSATNATITVTPTTNSTGTATIGVITTDSFGRTASTSFLLTVGDFTEVITNFPGLAGGVVRWVDFDNDGWLDLYLSGSDSNGAAHTHLYHNNGDGTFTEIPTPLTNSVTSTAEWADFDGDGYADLVAKVTPDASLNFAWTYVYKNNGGTNLTQVASLPTYYTDETLVWADVDNDGRPDILQITINYTWVYHNNGDGTFSFVSLFPSNVTGAAADYDGDGWIDVMSGSRLYRNTGTNGFVDSGLSFAAFYGGYMAWGDVNNDGWPDVLLTGYSSSTPDGSLTALYRNNGGTFTSIATNLPQLRNSIAVWGDFDNDGKSDLFMTGFNSSGYLGTVLRNNGDETFTDLGSALLGLNNGSAAWGDYDNDGALDLVCAGASGYIPPTTKLYHNDGAMPDTPPTVPGGLSVTRGRNSALLTWNAATDAEQTGGLTYNVRIGTVTNGINVVSPMADLTTGFRRIPKTGNAGYLQSFLITNLPAGSYYWSVQAIDNTFKGSLFAGEQSFTLPAPVITNQPQNLTVSAGSPAMFTIGATGATPLSYQWQVNGTNISGATNSSLVISPAQFADQGAYSVTVNNQFGSITSFNAILTVLTPPSLTQQPFSQTNVVGSLISFSVTATGTTPFGYQWFFNGAPLNDNGHVYGSTSNVLAVASVLKSDAGLYGLVVTNNYGSATSAVVSLAVTAPDVLINVDFGSGAQSLKTGAAAIGQTSADFWNPYVVGTSAQTNLLAADGTPTLVSVSVSGFGPVAPANGNPDPMYGHYLYQCCLPGNLTVTTTNLPPGTYDFYYYAGCGDYNYALSVNGVSQGQRQVWGSGSASTNWQEGVHYVAFRGVAVTNSASSAQTVITYLDSVCLEAVISGMQIAETFPAPTPPAFVSQPTNQTMASGFNANFQGGALGSPVISYQWFFNNAPLANNAHIAGADTFALTISNAQPADIGNYFLVASNFVGVSTSLVATLTVQLLPPVFALQPTNAVVPPGSNFVFSAPANGSIPIGYQWFFNGAPVPVGANWSGSTSPSLVITSAQTNNTGNYFVVASNNVSITTSSVAMLFVGVPPSIMQPPASATNLAGTTATLSVLAAGTPPLSYQWLLGGAALVDDAHLFGSTAALMTISNVQSADAGNYAAIITNGAGSVTSVVATLTVWTPPAITTQPIGRSVPPGLPTTFTAASSSTPLPATYQWQLNNADVSGATNTSYTIAAVNTNNLGFYHLVASNAAGVTVSADAKLTFGNVAAWGKNTSNESLPPPDLTNAFAVAGSSGASFAARMDGSLVSWGANFVTNIPAVATNVVGLSSGGGTVVLRSDGTITGWNFGTVSSIPVPPASNIVSVAAGYNFGFALRAEGMLIGWGGSPYTNVPAGLTHVTGVACGISHALALKDDGTVVSWGSGAVTNIPFNVAGVVGVAAGYSHSLALKTNGTVVAWGSGAGTNLPPGLTNIAAIFCGSYPQGQAVSLAIRSNGTIVAWGDNTGYGETNPPAALTNLISVTGAGAAYHALTVVNDGHAMILHPPVGITANVGRSVTLRGDAAGAQPLSYQWLCNGTNIPGATGTSLTFSNVLPANAGSYQLVASNSLNVAVSLPALLTVISNNAITFLAQPAGGTNYFQGGKVVMNTTILGNGPLQYQWYFSRTNIGYAPVPGATSDTLNLEPALAMQSGNYYVAVSNQFAGATSATVNVKIQFARAWGFQAVSNPPVNVTNAIAIATGNNGNYSGSYFVLGSDGKLTSWANYSPSYGETNVSALSNSYVTAFAAGYQDSLALKSDGTVTSWGYNYYGQTNVPVGLSGVVAIACGDYHQLALKSDGTVTGWGYNNYGQATNSAAATNVIAIAAGQYHSLALRADGSVIGWGNNSSGQTTIPPAATNVIALTAGSAFSAVLRANGTVVQWGNGMSSYPVPANLSNVVAISGSSTHCTALKNDGTVVSWGYEYVGLASNNVPSDLANVIAITSSSDHDFGLLGVRAPSFTIQPVNRTVFVGAPNALLAAKVVGVQPMTYQWQFNGASIAGATNDTLALSNLQFGQAGAYQLIASNTYGVVASRVAKLAVALPLGVALDATNLNWTSSGNAQWFGQTNVSHDGLGAARSGNIGNSQETILQTTFGTNWSGRYTFWWKVSSEPYFDTLEFRINGVVQTSISGEADWQQVAIPVAAATNVLQWRYSKDADTSSGQDTAWVDQFAFIPDPPVITLQPSPANQTVNLNATVSYTVRANGGVLNYQWMQNGTNSVGGNSSTLTLNNVGRAQNGTYAVTVSNPGGGVTSSNVTLKVLVPQLLGTPVIAPDGTLILNSTDANGGLLSPAGLANLQAQVSTNLVDWLTLTNALTLTNGVVQLHDPGATNSSSRFYRMVETP